MYYMFGFLFLVFIILVITCSEATILLCYFHLCAEVTVHTRDHMHILENCELFYLFVLCVSSLRTITGSGVPS